MKVCVFTGGSSAERQVAFATAQQVVSALRSRNHQVTVADTTRGLLDTAAEAALLGGEVGRTPPSLAELERLARAEREVLFGPLLQSAEVRSADVVFLALHGGRGEGGAIQNLLEWAGVRYTGAGPLASGVALDKDLSKRLFREAGVPTAAWLMTPATAAEVESALGWPVVVKPAREGSTVGLTVVERPADLAQAVETASGYGRDVMIEAFVPGRELTVGVLGDEALAVGEIIPRHALFDYECKYTPGMSREVFPAEIPAGVADEVRAESLRAHRALKLRGYSRVDFRLDPDGRLFCLEANTLPGMTATSLLPQSAAGVGLDFASLCERICHLALE